MRQILPPFVLLPAPIVPLPLPPLPPQWERRKSFGRRVMKEAKLKGVSKDTLSQTEAEERLRKAWQAVDVDHNGVLSKREMIKALELLHIGGSAGQVRRPGPGSTPG